MAESTAHLLVKPYKYIEDTQPFLLLITPYEHKPVIYKNLRDPKL